MLSRNLQLQQYFEKQKRLTNKKMLAKKEVQKTMDQTVKMAMAKNEKKFLQNNRKQLRETFFKDPPARQNRLMFKEPGDAEASMWRDSVYLQS